MAASAMRVIGWAGVLLALAGCGGSASRPPDAQQLARQIEALRPHWVWADYAARHVTCTREARVHEVVCAGMLVRRGSQASTTSGGETVARAPAGFRFHLDANGDLGKPVCRFGGSSVAILWAFCGPPSAG